jgi:membrane protein YqaA with SNARE-associated domain
METLTQFCVDWGYWGLFLSAFIAGSVIPFSSEAVLLVLVRMGLDPVWCILAATLGNTAGGMTCYWIGRLGKREWIHKYLRVSEQQLDRAGRIFAGKGAWSALFAFLPYVGSAISILLGIMRSNIPITLLAMMIGKALRYVVLLYLTLGTLFRL